MLLKSDARQRVKFVQENFYYFLFESYHKPDWIYKTILLLKFYAMSSNIHTLEIS